MKFPPNGFQIARITLLVRVVSNKNALYPYLSARSPAPGVPGFLFHTKTQPNVWLGFEVEAVPQEWV